MRYAYDLECCYFNPRSHERSDANGYVNRIMRMHFNPRSHERSDEKQLNMCKKLATISIHAPTRGATKKNPELIRYRVISIHAPTRGATPPVRQKRLQVLFQSTLPREERLNIINCCHFFCHFNPRSHERSDCA